MSGLLVVPPIQPMSKTLETPEASRRTRGLASLKWARVGRFNELRKVRSKPKSAAPERPFSRMYNFYVIEQGDKWAKTGTRFKPRDPSGYPQAESVDFSGDEATADAGKPRSSKSSPVLRAQSAGRASTEKRGRTLARAPEYKASHAPRSAKVTPHGVRPLSGGRNANIMGNRATPPPTQRRDGGKQAGSSEPEHSMGAYRMHGHQRAPKRPREDEETNMDLEFLGAGSFAWSSDEASARRFALAHPRHPKHMRGAHFSRAPYHHRKAWLPREEEQDYLYRMRPDVDGEVVGAVAHAVEMVYQHYQPPRCYYARSWTDLHHGIDPMDPMAPMHPIVMDAMDPMQHPEARLLAYHSLACSQRGYPDYSYDEYEREMFWSASVASSRRCVGTPVASKRRGAVAHDERRSEGCDREGCEEMSADDLLSCHSTPEGAQSIHEEFVGSPLELAERHELEWLDCSPPKSNLSVAHIPDLIDDSLEI